MHRRLAAVYDALVTRDGRSSGRHREKGEGKSMTFLVLIVTAFALIYRRRDDS